MKFEIESFDERDGRLGEWHRWFAWYPVRVGTHDVRWLEPVQRRGNWCRYLSGRRDWEWEYRPLGADQESKMERN